MKMKELAASGREAVTTPNTRRCDQERGKQSRARRDASGKRNHGPTLRAYRSTEDQKDDETCEHGDTELDRARRCMESHEVTMEGKASGVLGLGAGDSTWSPLSWVVAVT
jgi:hypothetical protein